jgi:PEP-CTERM motif
MKKLLPIAIIAFAMLLGTNGAKADPVPDVTFTLVQADLTGNPGDVLTWQYDVTNNSGGVIFANSIVGLGFIGGTGTPDPSVFDFFGISGEIANGSSLIGTLFAFDSDPAVMNSFNSGAFDLNILLADEVTTIDLLTNYSATITPSTSPVPEPASLMLLGSGIVGLLLLRRKLA